MRLFRITMVLVIVVSALVLPGCSPAAGPAGKIKLAFVTNNAADFWTIARKGCEQADGELPNVEVEFKISDGTAAEQRRIIDDLMAKGVSGIAISPVD